MGLSDIPPFWSAVIAVLIPVHLFGISGSLFYGGIQFAGLVALAVVGIRYVRTMRWRTWFFCIGYPLVVFVTNTWILLDEIIR